MARINDVGGTQGFGAVDTTDDTEPFHADWEARVFGIWNALRAQGVFNLDEFRDTIESMPPTEYLATSYYERWYLAVVALLERKGVIAPGELDEPGGAR
ncbi:SH3-like domain-containing protein [Streptomyces lincolnensis]|uniref:Nitrile hydratase beta subunit n=1 Tax=Streptomyces lincolnensis TaxID=1915 RepID=A0A1B1MAL1_STRLN|nr:SH3-like domain-containing protein [Streptomyces lincolnensis]ANS65554.1 Nitrile hydratase beta subunit [Streptomyces lincolnensis]AXG54682.1 Nitrile hydratase beta subunit [Streptomyces lincolnensis]QMV09033.1 nitrile hydratase subunit beta [Streptomyces lincolnensis]